MNVKETTIREKLPRFFQVSYRVNENEFPVIYSVEKFAKKNGISRNQAITVLLKKALAY